MAAWPSGRVCKLPNLDGVDGINVQVEGGGTQTLVFIHGWPDSYRLWDATVAGLQDRFRCVRFDLPGYDLAKPAQCPSLAEVTRYIKTVVDAVSPNAPVTLVLHDWGCTFGYEFLGRHPDRVARVVAVDIGNHNHGAYLRSLSGAQKRAIFQYQSWLALAWVVGRFASAALGNRMTRWMARRVGCPAPASGLHWQKNYPYAMLWLGLKGGFKGSVRVDPQCPFLYLYGARKPYMFHSPEWLTARAALPHNKVQAFATGHWVMLEQPQAFIDCLRAWLDSD